MSPTISWETWRLNFSLHAWYTSVQYQVSINPDVNISAQSVKLRIGKKPSVWSSNNADVAVSKKVQQRIVSCPYNQLRHRWCHREAPPRHWLKLLSEYSCCSVCLDWKKKTCSLSAPNSTWFHFLDQWSVWPSSSVKTLMWAPAQGCPAVISAHAGGSMLFTKNLSADFAWRGKRKKYQKYQNPVLKKKTKKNWSMNRQPVHINLTVTITKLLSHKLDSLWQYRTRPVLGAEAKRSLHET